ncbi:MAG: hypothetical protein L3J04_07685, partial [Robiginitomaculum sp.]|nr:hypothetical protein [Robiginitomaculum sp.]
MARELHSWLAAFAGMTAFLVFYRETIPAIFGWQARLRAGNRLPRRRRRCFSTLPRDKRRVNKDLVCNDAYPSISNHWQRYYFEQ